MYVTHSPTLTPLFVFRCIGDLVLRFVDQGKYGVGYGPNRYLLVFLLWRLGFESRLDLLTGVLEWGGTEGDLVLRRLQHTGHLRQREEGRRFPLDTTTIGRKVGTTSDSHNRSLIYVVNREPTSWYSSI